MSTLATQYFVKAKESFYYDPEETLEALNYAIGYDENHAGVLWLMGRFYFEHEFDLDSAIYYQQRAIANSPSFYRSYIELSKLYLKINEIEKARKALFFALKQTGVCKTCVYTNLAISFEIEHRFKVAKNYLKLAELFVETSNNQNCIDEVRERIKRKSKLKNKSKS